MKIVSTSRHAIQPVFHAPLAGDTMAGDAVRAPSHSVDLGSHNKNQYLNVQDTRLGRARQRMLVAPR